MGNEMINYYLYSTKKKDSTFALCKKKYYGNEYDGGEESIFPKNYTLI